MQETKEKNNENKLIKNSKTLANVYIVANFCSFIKSNAIIAFIYNAIQNQFKKKNQSSGLLFCRT